MIRFVRIRSKYYAREIYIQSKRAAKSPHISLKVSLTEFNTDAAKPADAAKELRDSRIHRGRFPILTASNLLIHFSGYHSPCIKWNMSFLRVCCLLFEIKVNTSSVPLSFLLLSSLSFFFFPSLRAEGNEKSLIFLYLIECTCIP